MKKWRKNIKRIFVLGLTTVLIGSTIDFPACSVLAQTENEIPAEKDIKDSDIGTETLETDVEEQTEKEQTEEEKTEEKKAEEEQTKEEPTEEKETGEKPTQETTSAETLETDESINDDIDNEQEQTETTECPEPQEELGSTDSPAPLYIADTLPPVTSLLVMGNEVVNGPVTSGDGWSFENNRLTLDNLHVSVDDYEDGVTHFIERERKNTPNPRAQFEIYLKGDNTIDGIAKVFNTTSTAVKITGDSGATLTINGYLQNDFEISGDIEITVNTKDAFYWDYGISIDNGAKVTINSNIGDKIDFMNYSVYVSPRGEVAIRNGSELTINTMNTTLNTSSYFSIFGCGPFIVEDSTVNIINKHANGIAVAVRDPYAGRSTTDDTVEIKNSTIHFEGMQGIRGYSANISDSTITIGDNTKLAFIGEHGEVEITNTTFTGITADYFVTADNPTKYKVYGDTVLPADLKIASGGTLSIPEDASLTIPEGVTLTNEGTMHIYAPEVLNGAGALEGDGTFLIDVTADLIDIPNPLCYTGKELNNKITLQDSLAIMGKSFNANIDGWELDSDTLGTVKEVGEYTVKYIKDGQSIEKDFTVEISATDVSAKTYNGDTETDTFTVDDTITVKATPTATGEAPERARMRSSYTAPTAGQMALFLNDTQISDTVSAQADGSYTMTVNASDVLSVGNEEPNGNSISLTAKFVGNNSMADAEATVDVTITADAELKVPDGTTRYVGNLQDAFEEENSGATVTLIKDVEGSIDISNSSNSDTDLEFTLDLNGHSLYSEYDEACRVNSRCNLTIIGDGKISGEKGIDIFDGTVNIKSGTIVGTVYTGIGVNGNATLTASGDAQIIGGTDSKYGRGLCVVGSYSKVSLSGGTFSGAAGAIWYVIVQEGDTLLDFLDQSGADQYAYFHGNTPITEGLVAEELSSLVLTGTVTVKPCTDHVWEAEHIENTGTHKQTCLACGLVEDAVKCSYTYTGIGTTQIGTCICGSIVKISLDNTSDLVYNGSVHTPDVTVTLDGQTLTKNTDYATTYQNNKNAGKASVQIKGLADYSSIDKEMEFTIVPKSLSIVSATAEDRAYDTTKTVRITDVALEGIIEGDDVKVDTDAGADGLTGTINSADVGSYTTVNLPQNMTLIGAEKDNYTLTQPTEAVQTNVTIRKAQGTLTVSDTSVIKTYGDEDFSLNCTTNGDGIITYAVSDSKDTSSNSVNDDRIITVSADGTVAVKGVGTATVTVSLSEGKNYTKSEDTLITITVQKAEKPQNTPDIIMEVSNRIEKVKDVALPEGWEWQPEDLDKPLEVGTAVNAVAVYTGADKDNYETDTVTIAITRSSCDHEAGDILYTGADDQAPTCTEGGLGHKECAKCGTVMETQIVVSALGHDYKSEVTKEPTVDTEGEMTYTCSRCGDTYTEPIEKKTPEGLWISGLTPSINYTGNAIKPDVKVYHGSTLLQEKTEYTITYKNNTNAGNAQIIVTGKGNYKGKATENFTITAVDFSTDKEISAVISTAVETGKNLKPSVTVTWNGIKLKEKKDYTLSYDTNIKTASTEGYDITINGTGNYTGTIVRKFHVKPKGTLLLNSAKVTGIAKSYPYQINEAQDAKPTGLEADLEKLVVKIGKMTLTKDTDYIIRLEKVDSVGTGTIVLEPTQTSAYAGEKRISFTITGTDLKKGSITGLDKTYPYTGEPVMPDIKVYSGKNGSGTPIPADAYTVKYNNYNNQGKATVTVTGIPQKGYSGSISATYAIGKYDISVGKQITV